MTENERRSNPINPYDLPPDAADEYFERFDEARHGEHGIGTVIPYYGSEQLDQFIEDEVIGIGTIVRVYTYEVPHDPHYCLTESGWRRYGIEDDKIYSPEEMVDKKYMDTLVMWELVGNDPLSTIGDE